MLKDLYPGITRHIKQLKSEVKKIEEKLDQLTIDTPPWKEVHDILMSVKGVGKVLTYTLLSDLPQLRQYKVFMASMYY
jgi:transposase